MEDRAKRVALVTGTSSGIGRAIATRLAEAGFETFGTSRRGRVDRVAFETLQVDVTQDESVAAAVQEVMSREGSIDVLVNNAGTSLVGASEENSIAQVQTVFDTNVFGVIRMMQAVLPHMRRQRSGRIVNISSVAGFMPFPFWATYDSTKHALEGYSESVDHEVRPFGVRVVLIEPGFIRTELATHSLQADQPNEAYAAVRKVQDVRLAESVNEGEPASEVARAVLRAVTDESPRLRYRVGKSAGRLSLLRRFLPERMLDSGLRRNLGLDAR